MTAIRVRITETTVYEKTYSRADLVGKIIAAGWPEDALADLAMMTDAELAVQVKDGRPAIVEEDMQSEGDVQGSDWEVSVVPG